MTSADIRIVERAAQILDAPGKWNRADQGECPAQRTTFTLYCALAGATREVTGKDDEGNAAWQEARLTIDLVAPHRYGARLDDFNGDSAVTFADLQAYFRILRNRLVRRLAEQAPPPPGAAGPGPADDSNARPPVTPADLRIVRRARQILATPARWNRADTRVCPPTATTFSLYCALERATRETTGSFAHRDAAMQEARFVIEDIAPNVGYYGHRLMDFNNDPATTFFDVEKFFQLLEERIAQRLRE